MENTQLYRTCLLKDKNEVVNAMVYIEKAQLGKKILHDGRTWEIKGVCSAIFTHTDMLHFTGKFKYEDVKPIEEKVEKNEHESSSKE